MDTKLKKNLMLQSLSPLAVLTIIRNFSFQYPDAETMAAHYLSEFFRLNMVLVIVFILCVAWIVAAVLSFISFSAFKWTDKKQGYQLSSYEEKEDASLNFFMTMIIPLLIDDVGTIQGAITFFIIVVMMCALLNMTNLYYANPVLAILGYRVYEIKFLNNKDFGVATCIGVVKGKLPEHLSCIEYKTISEKVLYIKEMKK